MSDAGKPELSRVLIALMKGVIYKDVDESVWQDLMNLQSRVRDYVTVLGLELIFDEAEGYAWLRSRPVAEGEEGLPRLVPRRQLSFGVSLLLALLRKKLVEFDSSGGDTRLIMSRDDVVEMMRVFLPSGVNEARVTDRISEYLNRVEELGFVRRLRGQQDQIEVRRILKAFVDAQWLTDFDQRLSAYRNYLSGGSADDEGHDTQFIDGENREGMER